MAYSTIKKKKCKCGCGKPFTLGYDGYRFSCAPQQVLDRVGSRKTVAKKNKAARTLISRKLHKAQKEVDSEKIELDLWFRIRRHEMTGKCLECNAPTPKENNEFYKWAICHVVMKSLVPSVKLHPDNWIELCRWHHDDYDHDFKRASKMKCFAEARRKFNSFKDLIPPEELRKVNPYLL